MQLPQAYAQNVSSRARRWWSRRPNCRASSFNGKVTHISGAIDVPTRSLQIEVTLPQSRRQAAARRLCAGRAAARRRTRDCSVPGNALLFRAEGPRVAVVDAKGNVQLRKIVIARDLGQSLEIESGIEPNDRIIINPSDSIADGDHVAGRAAAARRQGGVVKSPVACRAFASFAGAASVASVTLLAACTVGPDYRGPRPTCRPHGRPIRSGASPRRRMRRSSPTGGTASAIRRSPR